MPREKKDGRHLNIYIDQKIYEQLKTHADEKGQTVTTALERILKKHFDEYGASTTANKEELF